MTYVAHPVNFDGTNDWLSKSTDLTGNADSKLMTISFWVRRAATGANQEIYTNTGDRVRIRISSTNVLDIACTNTTGTAILVGTSSAAFNNTTWHHVMLSVDMSDTAKRWVYIDGSSNFTFTTYTDAALDCTRSDHSIGATVGGASRKLNGDLADLQIWFGVYVDLSVAGNRALFYSSGSAPVDPATAAASLGTPIIAQTAQTTAAWKTNNGSGGGFTENGALTDGGTALLADQLVTVDSGTGAGSGSDVANITIIAVDSGTASASGSDVLGNVQPTLDAGTAAGVGGDVPNIITITVDAGTASATAADVLDNVQPTLDAGTADGAGNDVPNITTIAVDSGTAAGAGSDVQVAVQIGTGTADGAGTDVSAAVVVPADTATAAATGSDVTVPGAFVVDGGTAVGTGADLSTIFTVAIDQATAAGVGADVLAAVQSTLDSGAGIGTGIDASPNLSIEIDTGVAAGSADSLDLALSVSLEFATADAIGGSITTLVGEIGIFGPRQVFLIQISLQTGILLTDQGEPILDNLGEPLITVTGYDQRFDNVFFGRGLSQTFELEAA